MRERNIRIKYNLERVIIRKIVGRIFQFTDHIEVSVKMIPIGKVEIVLLMPRPP